MDIYDLEEQIMNCWKTQEDIDLLCESILDSKISNEDIANVLLGLSKLHNLRCEKLFSTYENIIPQCLS